MKFLFYLAVLVAFVNADTREKCMKQCGVDPYLVKRVMTYKNYEYHDEKIMQFVLCDMKENGKIFVEHDLHDELKRIQDKVSHDPKLKEYSQCKEMSCNSFEELAWAYSKCLNAKESKNHHVRAAMFCGDKLKMSKALIEEMEHNHRKITTKGDKKKEFFFCYFEKLGWADHEGRLSKKAIADSKKVDSKRVEQFCGYLGTCRDTCHNNWDTMKCFVDKVVDRYH